ncbi:CpaF family protein [Paenibacillus thermotolerans]|uniref:CpaF family protein n=1 Tax=Paenibacillus thermotolerans TaxID=3027807 RepID=UPI0023683952|nr:MULTISPECIES: CpaF family protein [unclassified Paenibacillus]
MSEEWIRSVRDEIRSTLDFAEHVPEEELMEEIERVVSSIAKVQLWTSEERLGVVRRVFHTFRGLDVIQALVDDPTVTEIMVNSHDEIFFERNGVMHAYPHRFESRERLEDIIHGIVSKVNRTVNESSPIVDARLPDGSRVNVVMPPVALKGPALTIRKFPERQLTMADLIGMGAITEEGAAFLQRAVVRKCNIFVSGGTGSGKTTLLNVLAQWIPEQERVVTIEDSAELQLRTVKNVVSMETRNPNTEGKGEITIRQLIRASLRMRPNRIIVGEVRGAEALDMLQAMNTGHEGSLSTGHANSVRDMLSRLETMVLSGAELPLEVIRSQIASSLHVIVHLGRRSDYSRKVIEVTELEGLMGGDYVLNPLFRLMETDSPEGRKETLQPTGNRVKRLFQ